VVSFEDIHWRVQFTRYTLEGTRQKGYVVDQVEPDVQFAESLLEEGKGDEALILANRALDSLHEPLPRVPDWPYVEPNELEEILGSLPTISPVPSYDLSCYAQDVLGGWIGQIIGSALGLPVENWSYERIQQEIGEITTYLEHPPQTSNDDTTFQIISLHTLEEIGLDFRAWDLGKEWIEHISVALTAEGIALENLKDGLQPPETARRGNPFSEWVGGAMKAPIWGLLTPGRPDLAIGYTYRDAIIAHQGNGIFGALYTAALVSLAFVERDLCRLLQRALEFIPPKSRLAELIINSLQWSNDCKKWQQALMQYRSAYKAYHRTEYGYVHIFPCLVAALIGFQFGGGDFERSMAIATMCGGDTDFPPALIGTVFGIWLGEEGIPEKWRKPLGQTFETMAKGMERLSYTQVTERICIQGRRILEASG
jgi:ADP-ribosylglycohydrolase